MWDTGLNPSSYERIDEIKLPVIIIIGDRDSHFVLEMDDYINNRIENSKKVIMKDCGHLPYVEQAQEFNQIVLDFLTE